MGISPESSLTFNGIQKPPQGPVEDGVGAKLHRMFRRRRSQTPGAPEIQPINTVPPSQSGEGHIIDFTPKEKVLKEGDLVAVFQTEQEFKSKWHIRPIQHQDIDTMIQDGWFQDPRRVDHLKGDLINKDTLPKNWDDADEVTRFKTHLSGFYFPGGEFRVDALDNSGNLIRSALVERKTLVMEKNGVLAGTTSWLSGDETGDPWSDPADEVMRAHTQMHFVAKEFSGQGLGLALAIARTEAIFAEKDKQGEQKYEEIVTWVNTVGDYHVNEALFESMGYEEKGNKVYINTTDPDKAVKMRRYVLDRETWEKGAVRPDGLVVGRTASIERWEDKKKGINHRAPNLG